MTFQYVTLLPLPTENKCTRAAIRGLIQLENKWQVFGSRAIWLQLFLNPNISYQDIKEFHELVLATLYVYARFTPLVNKKVLFTNSKGYQYRANRIGEDKMNDYRNISFSENPEKYQEIVEKFIRQRPKEKINH
jgi:hypothetical protein